MNTIPHLKFPPQIGGDGHLSTVEQDSTEDILACVFVALKTPLGTRLYVPSFGISDYTFSQAPIKLSNMMNEIVASEPRAAPELEEQINELVETVTVGVSNVG